METSQENRYEKALDRVREELRVWALKLPYTEDRDTYPDGFRQGLLEAIRRIDRAVTEDAAEPMQTAERFRAQGSYKPA